MPEREIKFRAWDSLTKQWLAVGFHLIGEVTCFDIIGQKLTRTKPGETQLERMGDVVITQWTGLYDDADREIYEGDVIEITIEPSEFNTRNFGLMKSMKCKAVIKWETENLCFAPQFPPVGKSKWSPLYEHLRLCDSDAKVIGNVYEHPELVPQPPTRRGA